MHARLWLCASEQRQRGTGAGRLLGWAAPLPGEGPGVHGAGGGGGERDPGRAADSPDEDSPGCSSPPQTRNFIYSPAGGATPRPRRRGWGFGRGRCGAAAEKLWPGKP